MKKVMYTEKLHRHRLKLMMKRSDPCGLCPVSEGFHAPSPTWAKTLKKYKNNPCEVCMKFVGITFNGIEGCPCHVLGGDNALQYTREKLLS